MLPCDGLNSSRVSRASSARPDPTADRAHLWLGLVTEDVTIFGCAQLKHESLYVVKVKLTSECKKLLSATRHECQQVLEESMEAGGSCVHGCGHSSA